MNSLDQSRDRGRFKKGFVGNPAGRPKAGQSFKDRLAYWLETKTLKEIRAIVEDEKKFDKMPAIDCMVAQRVRQACKADGGSDFLMILDRLLGKPAMTAEVNVTHGLADRLDRAERILEGTAVEVLTIDSEAVDQNQTTTAIK